MFDFPIVIPVYFNASVNGVRNHGNNGLAGAMVTKSIPEKTLVAGVPA